ncbi:MAG: DUF5106 domain-containing protein [Bacteroidales bacterium]|nr:DUF5106 domain-containing protein [Bacteroidales bacterium]
MRTNRFLQMILPALLLLLSPGLRAGADIRCTIAPLHGGEVIFGHYLGGERRLIADDTLHLDAQGTAVVQTAEPLPQGMYFFYLPGKAKFDVLVGDDQTFSVRTDTAGLAAHPVFTGSAENEAFYRYNDYNRAKYTEFRTLSNSYASADAAGKNAIRQQMSRMSQEKNRFIDSLRQAHPGTYLSKVLGAILEPEVPDPPAGADADWQARWFRRHYFDHFDLGDSTMLRTPFYESRLTSFFSQYVPAQADSIIEEADKILTATAASPELFRFNLITLWNTYVTSKQMGMDAVWVHLAERWYLPHGTWLSDEERKTINDEVLRKKYNLIGLDAPALDMLMSLPADHFKLAVTDTATRYDLHAGTMLPDFRKSIQSDYIVIFFWDVTCSHCREFILKLHEVYPALKKYGVTVMTVQILISREGKSKWVDYINEHQLYDWMNTWSPYSAEYRHLYDTDLVPILYVLDKDRKIVAKQLQPEQLEDFLQFQQRTKNSQQP